MANSDYYGYGVDGSHGYFNQPDLYCPVCESDLEAEWAFCPHCGANIEKEWRELREAEEGDGDVRR